jgi:cytosine/adenosine deaminase-related metal-dependent hydrolase
MMAPFLRCVLQPSEQRNFLKQSTLHIKDAEVLVNADAEHAIAGDIWIKDGRILAVTKPDAAPPPGAGDNIKVIDARGCVAIPGLIDAHCHSYSSLLHGTVQGSPLDLFVLDAMARRAPRPLRSVYVSSQLHALKLLKHGVTGHVDHFRYGALPTTESIDTAFKCYQDIGIRATIAPMYEDKIYVDSLPIDRTTLPREMQERWGAMRTRPPEEYFDLMDSLAGWRRRDGRLNLMLGVDGPQRCTRRLLEMTGAYAEQHQMGLHTHLLEAKTQLLVAPKDTGGSFVAYLDQFGLVNPRSSLVHFVWCTERDMEVAAERGVSVVHNPVSNLHLGSGLQPTTRLLDLGVNVALGTDSTSCAESSILNAAKMMSLLSRIKGEPEGRWLREKSALKAATIGGAKVLGMAGELGSIEVGYRADIALIDTRGLDWRPRGNLHMHLVMYENGSNVRDVVVAGELVISNGKSTRIDEDALVAEGEEFIIADNKANEEWLAITQRERPVFSALLEEALAGPATAERFAKWR